MKFILLTILLAVALVGGFWLAIVLMMRAFEKAMRR